ncbi:winged helix DNA-binding protein [Desulfogranum mediterraneum]|uniref:winged helix DNA-binding protein n=1 Tax=Desulfogranum mediterraneum TaxID=160661 RepID=UPI00048D2E20|nr:winged helix DNA-binding protein [Desulfogranum mediterraneum]
MSDAPSLTELYPFAAIVSSEHLTAPDTWPLSELEYGMITAHNCFSRWLIRCMQAAGYADFSPLDVLVLHNVNHRNRHKRPVDICFLLHIEDQHTVNYSLKKLVKGGLVERQKRGKEIFYSTTEAGKEACSRYREIREKCLASAYRSLDKDGSEISEAAGLLRLMSGLYDQASRAASSF